MPYDNLLESPNPTVAGAPTRSATFRNKAFPTSPKFDDASTLYEVFEASVKKFANEPLLGHRPIKDGKAQDYTWLTYAETQAKAAKLSSALKGVGVQRGQRVAILGANCPEWMLGIQACNRMSYTCVPLYDTLGENAIEYIMDHSESVILLVSSEKLGMVAKAVPLMAKKPANIVYWGAPNPENAALLTSAGIKVHAFEDFVTAGAANAVASDPPSPEDMCTIMYTSGTTGDPKGVLLTHSAVVHTLASLFEYLKTMKSIKTFGVGDTLLSYLPLAHIFDRTSEELAFVYGGKIGYWQGKLPELLSDIAALKPTMFIAVPRVFDRIYSGVNDKMAKAGCLKSFLYKWVFGNKLARLQAGFTSDKAAPFWDKVVFNKVKAALGGNVRCIVSGGAPLANHVDDFLKVTMCCPVVQGYGLTETCAASFISVPDDPSQAGTCGPPQPVTQFCLESVPDMNYDALSVPPRGELLMKGENMFSGYYKMEDKTAEVLEKDGWFHTGDIAELMPNGSIKIIDRKKNIFKLSQGEYIAVEKLESEYKKCPTVNQVWVYGNSFESCVVSVVVPKEAQLMAWAKDHNITGTFAEVCQNKDAVAFILKELTVQAPLSKLKGFEVIKAVYLDHEEFSIEKDTLTPSFKLRRPQLQKQYQPMIDKMYEAVKSS